MTFDFGMCSDRVDALLALPAGNRRGAALQILVDEMFSSMPGVRVADRNVLAGHGEAELDLLLTNDGLEGGLPGFDRDLLIECKSSQEALSARDFEHFAIQVKDRHLQWSILVALNGISGTPDNGRAAQAKVRDFMREGHGVLLVVEHELRAMRSAQHLANFLEHKRMRMMGRLHTGVSSAEDIALLDPDPPRSTVSFLRGAEAIREAFLRTQRDACRLVVNAGTELSRLEGAEAFGRARQALDALDAAVAEQKEDPERDPFWRDVRDRLIAVGAAFVALLDHEPNDPDSARILEFDVLHSAPQRLRAHCSGDLWTLLTQYYLDRIEGGADWFVSRSSVAAVTSMCIEEIISIDDIDPHDVYDEWGDGPEW